MVEIPDSHPRKRSLLSRQKIVEGSLKGLLADSAMIAHGRGEAFDYLLGEVTTESAGSAIRESAARLMAADHPVISVNGNTVLLAGKRALRLAAALGCAIDVNLYYRTPERVAGLLSLMEEQRTLVLALKLAELELVGELYGESPILLLDDVLAELDPTRQLLLLDAVGETHQCLVSATHLDAFEGAWQRNSQVVDAELLKIE